MAETKIKTAEEMVEAVIPQPEKIVTIRLPRIQGEEEDKVVWVNERRFLIKRGVAVDVPESVALILEEEEKMLEKAYEYEQIAQNRGARK